MQLTRFTDYSLRVMVYLGVKEKPASVQEIAKSYSISRHHIVKVVHHLGKLGYVKTMRGKGGGVTLMSDPAKINIGALVDKVEPHFHIVGCFNPKCQACPIEPECNLKGALFEAQKHFRDTLARYTLADVLQKKESLKVLLALDAA